MYGSQTADVCGIRVYVSSMYIPSHPLGVLEITTKPPPFPYFPSYMLSTYQEKNRPRARVTVSLYDISQCHCPLSKAHSPAHERTHTNLGFFLNKRCDGSRLSKGGGNGLGYYVEAV